MLLCLAVMAGCGPVRQVDETLRRVDLLDRVFEPERFRPPPAPPAAIPAPPPMVAVNAAPPRAPDVVAGPVPEAVPEPPAAEHPQPPPDPAARRAALLRQNPWVTRFWSELTAAQQQRIARRLAAEDAPARWDRLGLGDRVTLLFGA
ncbi:hypothetical protein [Falsiroseomonas sp. CW058]|uniref:hypothetical protein n=1 Tax=Falsiroseomonas sp. CW058 TaxID=3388664 RepID=UPI003D31A95D